jgi:hypothetical protein
VDPDDLKLKQLTPDAAGQILASNMEAGNSLSISKHVKYSTYADIIQPHFPIVGLIHPCLGMLGQHLVQ